jgi:hypothetical protein
LENAIFCLCAQQLALLAFGRKQFWPVQLTGLQETWQYDASGMTLAPLGAKSYPRSERLAFGN